MIGLTQELLPQRTEEAKDGATNARRTKYQTVAIVSSVAVTLTGLGDADWTMVGEHRETSGGCD